MQQQQQALQVRPLGRGALVTVPLEEAQLQGAREELRETATAETGGGPQVEVIYKYIHHLYMENDFKTLR